jgi:GMP synthase-like glutamine amidotransferase
LAIRSSRRRWAAKVIASNDFCANAALLYDDRAFTVQAHPEFRSDFVDGLMQTRGKGVVPQDRMDKANARLSDALQDQTIATRIAAFFKAKRS